MWADTEGMLAVAGVIRSLADESVAALAEADPWGTMAGAATAGLRGALGDADAAAAVGRARLVAEVEERVLRVVAAVADASAELRVLAGAVVRAAQFMAATEDAVAAGLRRIDQWAAVHPDLLESAAAVGHRVVLRPLLGASEQAGLLTEGPGLFLGMEASPPRVVDAPSGLADLVGGAVAVEQEDGLVRVTELTRPDGSYAWVVDISGTQVTDPRPGTNPFDLTTDVHAIESSATIAAIGVHHAVLAAQRGSGRDTAAEPVLLVGHSLGGMLAAGLAVDPAFRHGRNVTGVVTAGSPIGRFSIPREVGVVAIEHRSDAVPLIDGVPGRVDDQWHTEVLTVDPALTDGRSSRSHAGDLYTRSAARLDAEAAGSEPAWQQVVAPFVVPGTTAVATDVVLSRVPQDPRR